MSQSNNHKADPSKWLLLYGDYLFSVAMMKVNDSHLAEDLLQETFLSAIKAASAFKGESSEKTWLTRILLNKITDHYRKKSVLKEAQEYLTQSEQSFTQHFFESEDNAIPHWLDDTYPKDWGAGADASINRQEFENILHGCIKKMPEKLSVVFLAKYMEEESSENICKDFDLSPSNYWVIIHRAKVLMRGCLEKNWFQK